MARSTVAHLEKLYVWALSEYQAFSMCLHDVESIKQNKKITYCIDGYDLCRYLFPNEFFRGQPNPHHDTMRALWTQFFNKCVTDVVEVTLSPFTLLELIATIEDRANDQFLKRQLRSTYRKISKTLDGIAKGIISLEEIGLKQKQTIVSLYEDMITVKKVNAILEDEDAFKPLADLLENKKIRVIEKLIRKQLSVEDMNGLLSFNRRKVKTAFGYLKRSREDRYGQYGSLYVTMDIYHYILIENLRQILSSRAMKGYLTSSGILSRNSWMKLKYGKLLDDLEVIPKDWAGRASTVPYYVMKGYANFNGDLKELQFFLEDGKSEARKLLRELRKIPEIMSCIESKKERDRLHKDNPEVEISRKLGTAAVCLHDDYHRMLIPELIESIGIEREELTEPLDVEKLLEWMRNPQTRGTTYQKTLKNVRDQIKKLEVLPVDWRAFIAPLGKSSYDILRTFDKGIDY